MFIQRARRNRKSAAIRRLVQETWLRPTDLIAPFFVQESEGKIHPHLPALRSFGIEALLFAVEKVVDAKIPAIALFPVIENEQKDERGSFALDPNNLLPRAVRRIKECFPDLCVITDVALDPYTSHGHDGIVGETGEVLNDPTVEELIQMALIAAESGVDMVAPSDMMDGRVGAIRKAIDKEGFTNVGILSYALKYASSLYGPYRTAVGSPIAAGAKDGYQLNPANTREGMREGFLDEQEGADILMVKPAGFYLDVISKLKAQSLLPIAAFQVSGEYAMLKSAALQGWLDYDKALIESLLAIKRAGADMIFCWAALEAAFLINEVIE